MADDIRLKLFLESSQESLRTVKKDVERALKTVRVKLKPETSGSGPFVSGPSGGRIQSDIARVAREALDASARLSRAQAKRASAIEKAIADSKTAEEAGAAIVAVQRKYETNIKRLSNKYLNLIQSLSGLEFILDESKDLFAKTSGKLSQIAPGGVGAALSFLEVQAFRAARVFESLKDSKGLFKAFDAAQVSLQTAIGATKKSFFELGFKAEDGVKLLAIAMQDLVGNISKVDIQKIVEANIRRSTSENSIQPGERLLQDTIPRPKLAAGAALDKELQAANKEFNAASALIRIKTKALGDSLISASKDVERGGIVFVEEAAKYGRGLKNATVRILNDAVQAEGALVLDKDGNIVRAEGALVSELYAQIEGLQRSIDAELKKTRGNLELVKAQDLMIENIRKTIDGFKSLGRPVKPLTDNLQNLILTFGSLPEIFKNFVNQNKLGGLGITIDQARNVLKQFGTDFKGLAEKLIELPDEVDSDEVDGVDEKRAKLVALLTEAYAKEIASSKAITAQNNKLVAGRDKRSKTFEGDAKPVLDAELSKFRVEIKKALDSMKGAGKDAARLGQNASDFDGQLEFAKVLFINALDQSKVAFFNVAEEGESLKAALDRLAKGFQGEFFNELENIAKAQAKEQKRIASIDRKIAEAREGILSKQKELIDAINKSIIQEATIGTRRDSSTSVIGQIKNLFKKQKDETVKAELKSFADVQKVGQSLDPTGQEKFLKALRGESVSLKEINSQLKQHQGNLAKSSALVDRMTASMTSGQKAAFQFGFAAANAAERLTAWASPAAFMFETISLLREATTNIVKLDSDLRKLVFFSPEFVASQIASLRGLDESVQQRIATDQKYAQQLADSAGTATQVIAKNRALADSFRAVIDRSRETGLAIEDITSGLLATARVGQAVFERNAQSGEIIVSSFFRAVEAFKRVEGAAASTDTVVSLLNSTLNEFGLSAENAVSVTAAIADAAGKSALEGQELFDVLVRTGGAFNFLTNASIPESLAVIQRATEANIPSVSKLATAIRQFTTLAIDNADAIERFSGIKLIEGGQIKDMETFVAVLGKLNELAPAARNEFLSLFSERDTGATILALSSRAKELRQDLIDLSDAEASAGKASDQTRRLLEQQLFQQEDLTSTINKFKASLTSLVKESGFAEFLKSFVKGATGASDVFGEIAGFIDRTVGLFKLLGAIAAPTILNILRGFRQGFLERQNSYKVEQEILGALRQELGATEAINKAEIQGLVTKAEANTIRAQNVAIASELIPIKAKEEILQVELNALKRIEGVEQSKIKAKEQEIAAIETKKIAILKQELALRQKIEATTSSGIAKLESGLSRGFKNAAIAGGSLAAIELLPNAVNAITTKLTGDKKVGSTIESVVQNAVLGAIGGSAFGPIGTIVGATVGGIGAIVNARKEAAQTAKEQARIELESSRAYDLELKNFATRQALRVKTSEDVSRAEREVQNTLAQIERLEIEINRIGAEKAENEGLLAERQELQADLNRKQLQLRQREKAELAETVEFEETRANIRERLLTVEKALSVQRQAQLALAESFGQTKLQAQIELDFDVASINKQKDALTAELNEISIRLAALRAEEDTGKAQQIKDLEKEKIRISNEITRNELDVLSALIAGTKKNAEVNIRTAEEQINSWQTAAGQVVSAFRSVVSSQIEVARIIERQGDILKSIIEEESKGAQRAVGGPGDTRNLLDREQAILSLQQGELTRQLSNARRIFSDQRNQLDSKTASEIEVEAQAFREALNQANLGLGEFGRETEVGGKRVFKALETQRQALEANIELAKGNIQLEIDFTGRIIDVRRKEIEILNKSIELQQKRNEQDAEFGKKLLTTPDAFLQEIKSIATAQRFFRGLQNGDARGIEGRIRNLQGSQGGFTVLRQVLDGLEAAVRQGLSVAGGFSPEALLQTFSRLQIFSANDIKGTEAQEQTLISSVDNVSKTIVDELNKQLLLVEEEKGIQNQIQEIARLQHTIAGDQLLQLQTIANAAIAQANQAVENNRTLAADIGSKMEAILGELPQVDSVTAGERQIKLSVDKLGDIMDEIRQSSPDVRTRRNELRELGQLALSAASIQNPGGTVSGAEVSLERTKEREKNVAIQIKELEDTFEALAEDGDRAGLQRAKNLVEQLKIVQAGLVASREKEESQLNTLRNIEFINNRMTELQNKLLFEFSKNPKIREAEANQLFNGFPVKTGELDALNAPRPNNPVPVEVTNPISAIPSGATAPGDMPTEMSEFLRIEKLYRESRETAASKESFALQNALLKFGEDGQALLEAAEAILEFTKIASPLNTVPEPRIPTEESLKEFNVLLKSYVEALNSQRGTGIKIAEDSIDDFRNKLEGAFDGLVSRVEEARIKIDVPGVNVQLDANIKQQLQGDEFAQQLAAAFQGTGLEDRVNDIQGVVAKLVSTALGRGETFDGVDVIEFGGRLT